MVLQLDDLYLVLHLNLVYKAGSFTNKAIKAKPKKKIHYLSSLVSLKAQILIETENRRSNKEEMSKSETLV